MRSIGIRGAGLVEMDSCFLLSMFQDDKKRDKWERIGATVDKLRERYGYMSVQRALMRPTRCWEKSIQRMITQCIQSAILWGDKIGATGKVLCTSISSIRGEWENAADGS